MRITESRLRRIIRETLAEMETDWWRKFTPLDVKDVLSALTEAPPSAWDGPTWNPEGVEVLFKKLPEMNEPFKLLKAIKGWIQGIEFRTPGMKRALNLIDGVAVRVGVEIPPAISSLKMEVEELIDRAWAWDDEDGEEVDAPSRRVVTGEDVARVLQALTRVPGWDTDGVTKLFGLTRLHEFDAQVADDPDAGDSGVWVLSGIKGWIEDPIVGDEPRPVRLRRFKPALDAIEEIAKRKGITITGSDPASAVGVYDLLDSAYTA